MKKIVLILSLATLLTSCSIYKKYSRPEEISTDKLGELVMEKLKPIDEVAYIRFASIYHRYQDAGSFMREISKFLEEK